MIIKKVIIENYMCYYDIKTFEFTNGLNIILGDNGEGKTKFFDAIEWLFQENNTDNDQYISEKKLFDTNIGETFCVSVQVELAYESETTLFIKKFEVEKLIDQDYKTRNVTFSSIEDKSNGERVKIDGLEAKNRLNFLFPNAIRKYSMFRGESSLNIFSKKNLNSQDNALINLVNLFSDSNLYQKYASKASALKQIAETEMTEFTRTNARNLREYNTLESKIAESQREIHKYKSIIEEIKNNNDLTKESKKDLEKYIKNAKTNDEINIRINALEIKKKNIDTLITNDEEYNIPLLDDSWVLLNFEQFQDEFSKKINNADEQRRSFQQDFDIKKGETKGRRDLQAKLLNNTTPLPIGVPDRYTMEGMLKDQICKVCNREAIVGSEAYNYMESNLKDFLISLEPVTSVEIDESLFKNNYIKSLASMALNHESYISKFRSIESEIIDKLELNKNRKEIATSLQKQLDDANDDKVKLFGDIDQSENSLSSIMTNYIQWTEDIVNNEKNLYKLDLDLQEEIKKLNDANKAKDKIDLESGNNFYSKKLNLFKDIEKIFIDIKDKKFDEYIIKLENKSNEIFQNINVDSFIGKIKFNLTRIYEKVDVKVELVQEDGSKFSSPNQSLETSMHIAVLFAISQLATDKQKEDYPLIFDAPTSSFGEAKTASFLNQLNENNSQKILLTYNFLTKDEKGVGKIKPEFNKVKRNKAYWVKLSRPFSEGMLHTINTIIEDI